MCAILQRNLKWIRICFGRIAGAGGSDGTERVLTGPVGVKAAARCGSDAGPGHDGGLGPGLDAHTAADERQMEAVYRCVGAVTPPGRQGAPPHRALQNKMDFYYISIF